MESLSISSVDEQKNKKASLLLFILPWRCIKPNMVNAVNVTLAV